MKIIKKKTVLIITLLITTLIGCDSKTQKDFTEEKPYLIILSLDGFRWDYCNNATTPTFDSLAKIGAKAQSLRPCFPTKHFLIIIHLPQDYIPTIMGLFLIISMLPIYNYHIQYEIRKL